MFNSAYTGGLCEHLVLCSSPFSNFPLLLFPLCCNESSLTLFVLITLVGSPSYRWVMYVNGKERITDCPAVNTGQWYHIGASWRSWDGDWRIYINGKPSDGGKGLSVGTTIPGVVLSSTFVSLPAFLSF